MNHLWLLLRQVHMKVETLEIGYQKFSGQSAPSSALWTPGSLVTHWRPLEGVWEELTQWA